MINLVNFFVYFDKENPNHLRAIQQLKSVLANKVPEQLLDTAEWIKTYRTPLA